MSEQIVLISALASTALREGDPPIDSDAVPCFRAPIRPTNANVRSLRGRRESDDDPRIVRRAIAAIRSSPAGQRRTVGTCNGDDGAEQVATRWRHEPEPQPVLAAAHVVDEQPERP